MQLTLKTRINAILHDDVPLMDDSVVASLGTDIMEWSISILVISLRIRRLFIIVSYFNEFLLKQGALSLLLSRNLLTVQMPSDTWTTVEIRMQMSNLT